MYKDLEFDGVKRAVLGRVILVEGRLDSLRRRCSQRPHLLLAQLMPVRGRLV